MISTVTEPFLTAVNRLPDLMRSASSKSYIDYTRPTRIEPITLIDSSLINFQEMPDIMQTVNSIFAGYYLQAAQLSVNVGDINVVRLLEKLNPNRNVLDGAAGSIGVGTALMSMEAYENGLPDLDNLEKVMIDVNQKRRQTISMEAASDDKKSMTTAQIGRGSIEELNAATNLSVGKQLSVVVESNGQKAEIMVNVRLMTTPIQPDVLNHILTHAEKDNSWGERIHGWKSGRLEALRDLLLAEDIIREHRRALIKDTSGTYATNLARAKSNKLTALITANPSIAVISSIVIMSADSAAQLERSISGKLKDFKTRERILNKSYTMLLVIVDVGWKRVTIYHSGINTPTELSINDMKAVNKKGGPNITEVLQALRKGDAAL